MPVPAVEQFMNCSGNVVEVNLHEMQRGDYVTVASLVELHYLDGIHWLEQTVL